MQELKKIHARMKACRKCPAMCGPAVHGPPSHSHIMLVGQAPGSYEGPAGKPFAHTAGKTLFKWLGSATGANEEDLREMIYFSAVARCFPGKAAGGKGDRVPDRVEIENCSEHLKAEIEALRPKLILAVGKLAISETLRAVGITSTTPLEEVVGKKVKTTFHGHEVEVIALPHPSGVSRWPHTPVGKARLGEALELVKKEFKRLV